MRAFTPRFLPVLKEGYSLKQFTKDLTAALIVGIVALPLTIAFAIASGVSPQQDFTRPLLRVSSFETICATCRWWMPRDCTTSGKP